MTEGIPARYAEVLEKTRAAACRSGRDPKDVTLMVVSKTWPVESVRELVSLGQFCFGENRLQEGEEKVPALPNNLSWHFIGTLQRNKVRKVLPLFPVIHSVSGVKLVRSIERIAEEIGKKPEIYLEVNLGAEERKHGFTVEELMQEAETLVALKCSKIQGLMCIPPKSTAERPARHWFSQLRKIQSQLRDRTGLSLPEMSMGMSGDYEDAILEGATVVRVGSAIFGERGKR